MIINNFIIASRAYFQQSPTCTRVNNLVNICSNLTPMAFWRWSCFARGRGLSKDLTLQVYLYLHLCASLILQWVGITHSPMRWFSILVSWWDLNSSARINVTTITKMELHRYSHSWKFAKLLFVVNTTIYVAFVVVSITIPFETHSKLAWNFLPAYHLLFNTYLNLR